MSAADNLKPSPLDRPLTITFFTSFAAAEKREEAISLRDIMPRIKTTTHALKTRLPWLKLAKFGSVRHHRDDTPVERQSLRHNDNVVFISGVEADYDAERLSVDQAVLILRTARVAGMIYTSPSHTADAPRWRVLCPLSQDMPPAARVGMVERLNGIFCGALAGESFTLSQSYYFGSIKSNPSHEVHLVDGAYLDARSDLDDAAVGKPRSEVKYTPPTERRPDKSRFVEAVIANALSKVRAAADGSKHNVLRAQAKLLGGYQHAGSFTTDGMAATLVSALPASTVDYKAALTTALWGLEKGATMPIEIPDLPPRPIPEPPPADPDDPGFDPSNVVQFPSDVAADAPPIKAETPRIKITRYADVEATTNTADLIEDYLGAGAMSVLYGESNSGKTFFATNMGFHVANGWEWNGRHVERTGVIYCAMEGAHGISNRIAALKEEYGVEDVPFGIVTIPLDLCQSDSDSYALIAAIKAEAIAIGFPIGLIILDTVARALAGGNENAPDDMGALVRNGDLIRNATGAHVMWIHHSGKDQARGARGHSSLRAATDTEIEVSADGESRVAKTTKQREYECSGEFSFKLKVVEIGTNKRGKVLTSCVVVSGQERPPGYQAPKKRHLSGNEKRAFEVLQTVITASGRTGMPGVPTGISSIPDKWWRDHFYDSAMPGDNQETKQKAFKRASTALINNGFVGMVKGYVWGVPKTETDPDISQMSGLSG